MIYRHHAKHFDVLAKKHGYKFVEEAEHPKFPVKKFHGKTGLLHPVHKSPFLLKKHIRF